MLESIEDDLYDFILVILIKLIELRLDILANSV